MSEPSLAAVQRWMQEVLVHPLEAPEEGAQRWLPEDLQDAPVDGLIAASGRLSPRAHLAIYQRSYLARLRECMAAHFPTLQHALGPELFQLFADQYLQACPSTSPTLADLGDRFPDHLEETRPDRDQEQREAWPDFMIELARFELAINGLFDEEEPEPEPGQVLLPLVRLFRHSFPIARYHRAAGAGGTPELPLPEPTACIVVRRDLRLAILELMPAQVLLVELLLGGASLEEARGRLVDGHGLDAEALERVWPAWIVHLGPALAPSRA